MTDALKISALFDVTHSLAAPYLARFEYPWEALAGIADFVRALGQSLPADEFEQTAPDVWAARDAQIAPTALVQGPCVIDHGAQVRHCAFIRGSALIGKNAVVGNSVEIKNAILFDGAQVPHFNYVGDSILGYRAHMGAGSVTSNFKSDKTNVAVRAGETVIPTGLRKLGAMLGDHAEVGCNSVLCPGSVIGRECVIYPTSCVRGFLPARSIFKDKQHITTRRMA